MGDLQQTAPSNSGSGSIPMDNPGMDMNISQLETAIKETAIKAGQERTQESNPTPVVEPVVTQPNGESAQPQGTATQSPAVVPVTEPPKADAQQTQIPPEVQAFAEKKGLKEVDLPKVVKMYEDLEKGFHAKAGELAQLRKAPEVVAQPPVEPGAMPANIQEQFLADLQRDPIGTMNKFVQLTQGPKIAELSSVVRQQKLHNTVVSLSTNPETSAEFNSPTVQAEMQKVFEENPSFQTDVAGNLQAAMDIAVGRLYRSGKLNPHAVAAGRQMAIQQQQVQQAATMPGAAKPPAPAAPKPISQMTSAEIEQQLKGVRWGAVE